MSSNRLPRSYVSFLTPPPPKKKSEISSYHGDEYGGYVFWDDAPLW
jgi:hypothetical protein